MCSIIGIRGQNVNKQVLIMLNSLKHRGPDASGAYVNGKLYYNNQLYDMPESNFILAHNLLSIVGNNSKQPIQGEKLTIIANAEIYNYDKLVNNYNLKNLNTDSDCEIILKLIEKFYINDLKKAVLKTIDLLDGDYAFCVTDGNNYMVLRDNMGVKPLYYAEDEETFAFASECKALENINFKVIESLKPTEAIYNNKIITVRQEYLRTESDRSYDDLKEDLKQDIIEATRKRVQNLDQVALLFSAGVDSTLIAAILKKLNIKTTLYTVGTENSQDIKFAKQVAKDMDLPLKTMIIDREIIEHNFSNIINIIEDTNLMKIGVGMTIYLTSQMAHDDGHKVILSGQGADELFCGYNRYKNKYDTPKELMDELTYDLNNMYHVNLERDDKATMSNSVELRVPFLDNEVISTASKMPVKYMLHSKEDNIRKHILRDIAYELGVPEYIAYRPKKAAQYGTGIDKIIRKKLLKNEEFQKLIQQ